MAIQITMKCVPELDPEFVPAALWNREYGKLAAADAGRRKLALCVERANGCVSRFDTVILADTPENRALNLRYVERIVKFLLWARGGWKLTVAGAPELVPELAKIYSAGGERKFDYAVIGKKIYDHPFTVVGCAYEAAPEAKEIGLRLGGHFDGCRIGFDLGGSDRKCAAVIDGETVHSEEVVWDPYFQGDINYHIEGIVDSLKRAAARLPRIDSIGGSAAGVYVDNQPRIASLFRGIPEEQFESRVRPIFLEIAKQFPGVPFVVLNDGEVTALAGAVSIGRNALLGLAMGTSEAVGFVTPEGTLTDHLNELAFAPATPASARSTCRSRRSGGSPERPGSNFRPGRRCRSSLSWSRKRWSPATNAPRRSIGPSAAISGMRSPIMRCSIRWRICSFSGAFRPAGAARSSSTKRVKCWPGSSRS